MRTCKILHYSLHNDLFQQDLKPDNTSFLQSYFVKFSKMYNAKMRQPKASSIILSVLALGTFLFKIVLNALAGSGHKPFSHSIANVSDTYTLDITPAGWAFSIWGLIYTWNLAYIVYALTTEFRDVPPVLNELFYFVYIVCDIANVAWLYVFTGEFVVASCVILVVNQVLLYALLYVVYVNYSTFKKELEQQHLADAVCMAVLVQNGKYCAKSHQKGRPLFAREPEALVGQILPKSSKKRTCLFLILWRNGVHCSLLLLPAIWCLGPSNPP